MHLTIVLVAFLCVSTDSYPWSSTAAIDHADPRVISAEAYPGKPFGIGKVVFRISESDRQFAETGALTISEKDGRVFIRFAPAGFSVESWGEGSLPRICAIRSGSFFVAKSVCG